MTRYKVILGVLSVTALCVFALGASSASALTLEECKAEAGTGAACETGKNWTGIVGAQPVDDVAAGTTTLAATVAGIEFEIQCTGQNGSGTAENVTAEPGVPSKMHITGTNIVVNYTGCSVTKPAGNVCTVASTLTTNSLKSTTVTETMVQRYEPTAAGGAFIEIVVSGASCPAALKGTKAVKGFARATNEPEAECAQRFTIGSGSALTYAGQAAGFLSANKFATDDGTPVCPRTP